MTQKLFITEFILNLLVILFKIKILKNKNWYNKHYFSTLKIILTKKQILKLT